MIKKTSLRITVTLDKNLVRKIDNKCKRDKKTKSEIIELMLKLYFNNEEIEDKKFQELIEQVKRLVFKLDKIYKDRNQNMYDNFF
ncbi:MAG: ribbon-helix-helix domain-containing protein [Campylobacteraceae bacterium]|nr:ribbon-helix-helix domain-containing protein [Campylobacteraceae bacterium]